MSCTGFLVIATTLSCMHATWDQILARACGEFLHAGHTGHSLKVSNTCRCTSVCGWPFGWMMCRGSRPKRRLSTPGASALLTRSACCLCWAHGHSISAHSLPDADFWVSVCQIGWFRPWCMHHHQQCCPKCSPGLHSSLSVIELSVCNLGRLRMVTKWGES